jgi:hypothetical protein
LNSKAVCVQARVSGAGGREWIAVRARVVLGERIWGEGRMMKLGKKNKASKDKGQDGAKYLRERPRPVFASEYESRVSLFCSTTETTTRTGEEGERGVHFP